MMTTFEFIEAVFATIGLLFVAVALLAWGERRFGLPRRRR